MSTGVRVKGLKETIRALERLGVSVEDLKQALTNTTERVVRQAREHTPVRSGRLQGTVRGSKAKNKAVIRAGSAKAYYASYVEYGAAHNTAVGMITEAVTANQQYMVDQLDSEVQGLIRKYNLD